MTRLKYSEIREASTAIHTRGVEGNTRGPAAIKHAKVLDELAATIETDGTVRLSRNQINYMQGELARAANAHTGKAKLNISRAFVSVSHDKNYRVTINWSGRGEPEGTGVAPALEAAFSQAVSQSIENKIDTRKAKRELAGRRATAEDIKGALLEGYDPEEAVMPKSRRRAQTVAPMTAADVVALYDGSPVQFILVSPSERHNPSLGSTPAPTGTAGPNG